MNAKREVAGIIAGFFCYLFFSNLLNFSFLSSFFPFLPFILFLAGIGIGYFIKKFKNSLICGGIASVIGIIVFLLINFENFALFSILNGIGLFFGFGFGAILYYRVGKKKKINNG